MEPPRFSGVKGSEVNDAVIASWGPFAKAAGITALVVGILAVGITGIYSGAAHANFAHTLSQIKAPVVIGGIILSAIVGIGYAMKEMK